jgi:hypothetical protein
MSKTNVVEAKHIKELNEKILSLRKLNKQYLDDSEANIERLIKIIPRPGWTTPAEFLLVNVILDSMIATVKQMDTLGKGLVEGASQVAVKG